MWQVMWHHHRQIIILTTYTRPIDSAQIHYSIGHDRQTINWVLYWCEIGNFICDLLFYWSDIFCSFWVFFIRPHKFNDSLCPILRVHRIRLSTFIGTIMTWDTAQVRFRHFCDTVYSFQEKELKTIFTTFFMKLF